MRAVRVVVRGRVQGVFFRISTREEARRLGIVGWVRNKHDGSVECWAQGPKAAIDALISFLHKGPPAAWVETVDTHEKRPDPIFDDFKILY